MILGNKVHCPKFEDCEAPLCPLQENTLEGALWYADEEICRARKFQSLLWIQKQKRIAKLGLSVDDGFFSLKMVNSIRAITKNLKGADPNNFNSEEKWLKQRLEKRAMVSQKRGDNKATSKEIRRNSVAKKRDNLVNATNTSNQDRGGGK